jgi:hypothetical protein
MACNMKTMLKVGLGMLLVTGIAYAALPEFRDWILASSPILFLLLCPLSLLLMMTMMNGESNQVGQVQAPQKKEENVPSLNTTDPKTS